MKTLDDELRDALCRKEPPAGFADRVLARARVASSDSSREVHVITPRVKRAEPPFMLWAAAAVLVMTIGSGLQYLAIQKQHDERARGEAAKEQVVQALRLAGSKLQLVQTKIRESGS